MTRRCSGYAHVTAEQFDPQLGLHAERPAADGTEPATLRVRVTANLNGANAPVLRRLALDGLHAGRTRIVIDLEGCRSVDANGWGVLTGIANQARRAGGSVTLLHVGGELRATMREYGITGLFTMSGEGDG